jgi:5-methylthioadenosine/S-adenosylhomocysteine deaminase
MSKSKKGGSMSEIDILIKNGTILTVNGQDEVIKNGLLGIKNDEIVFVSKDDQGEIQAEKTINAEGGLITPGLVNAHTHAAMSLFRGLADDLPLMDWLNNYIFPVESRMDQDFVYTGTLLAGAEMIMSGTTTFCDMYLFEEEVARAGRDMGLRCLVGEVLYDFDSPNYGPIENGLRYTEELIQRWQGDPLVSIAVEPHATFTCSPDLLKKTKELADKYHVPLIIHLSETKSEWDQIQETYGLSPVAHLESLGLLGPNLIADHCVHLSDRDKELLALNQVKVVHNPESNMKLASGIAPVPDLLKQGIVVGLGTDGCASNNNLDLFLEMDMAAKLHKVAQMDTTVMDAKTVFRMATIEGAKALGLDRLVGSLEPGKKADIIIIDINKPHLTPMYNPFSHLVYAVNGRDVKTVLINGRVVMEDRKLLSMDPDEIMDKSRRQSQRIREWLPQ